MDNYFNIFNMNNKYNLKQPENQRSQVKFKLMSSKNSVIKKKTKLAEYQTNENIRPLSGHISLVLFKQY